GIRDFHVTGVQTCALPISRAEVVAAPFGGQRAPNAEPAVTPEREQVRAGPSRVERSRRVGLSLGDVTGAPTSGGGPSDAASGGDAGEEQATQEHVGPP